MAARTLLEKQIPVNRPCMNGKSRGSPGWYRHRFQEVVTVFRHTKLLQFEAKPEKPDPVYARKLQELIGG
ncbi:manganese catalase family protein, partial [Amycolatopsis magusensis]|uniref:manganese catalase family protein n=1 Tax=Amycolatopsis magusensis TaxID=882444 RepID=UPI00378BC596